MLVNKQNTSDSTVKLEKDLMIKYLEIFKFKFDILDCYLIYRYNEMKESKLEEHSHK